MKRFYCFLVAAILFCACSEDWKNGKRLGEKPVLFPDLTYGFYKVWADLYRINYHEVPLTSDFEIDGNDYIADNGGVVLTNPNAPTGIYKSLEAIEAISKD